MALYSRTDNDAQKRKVGATNELNSVTTDPAQNPTTQPQAKVIPSQYIFIDDTEATIAENKKRGLTAPGWWKYFTYTDASGETRHKAQHLVAFADAPTSAGDTDDQYAADASSTITISIQPTAQTAASAGRINSHSLSNIGTTIAGQANQSYTLTGLAGSAAGTGASFTLSRGSNGAFQSTALVGSGLGAGFVAGETITILGSLIGGVNTTDNAVITVGSVLSATATFSVTAAASTGSLVYQWQLQTATGTRWANITGANSASLALTSIVSADSGKKYRVRLTSSAGATEVISNVATLTV